MEEEVNSYTQGKKMFSLVKAAKPFFLLKTVTTFIFPPFRAAWVFGLWYCFLEEENPSRSFVKGKKHEASQLRVLF